MKLYGNPDAGKYLKWFAPLAIMLYCDAVTDAMIKGLGEQKASVRYNILTNTMDVALLFVLLPRFGILGYFFSFTVTHVINFILSIRRLLKITNLSIDLKAVFLTLISACLSVSICRFVNNPIMQSFSALLILGCLLTLLGVFSKDDLYWILKLIRIKK